MADTTPTLREAAQQALEALETAAPFLPGVHSTGLVDMKRRVRESITALRSALAEQAAEQAEPVADAARDVLAERQRQISVWGFTSERDDSYRDCQLAAAAATYALCERPEQLKVCGVVAWPWPRHCWKPTGYRRNLVKAGSLILAEIERLDRAAPAEGEKQ